MMQYNIRVAFKILVVAFVRPWRPLRLSSIDIKRKVAEAFDVSVMELTGQARARHIAYARFAAYDLMRRTGRLSLPQIGHYMGGRDHSTIIYGIKRCADLRATDSDFAERYRMAREL